MGDSKRVLFRRSPFLICYWASGEMVFENYATGARIGAAPLTCEILNFFDGWRPANALHHRMPAYSSSSLQKAIAALAQHSLLQRSDRPAKPVERSMESWKDWNPAAGFFHFSTKDVPFTFDVRGVRRQLRRRAQRWPVPSPVKHYRNAHQIRLSAPQTNSEFAQVLLARRTWRRFSPRPIELDALATLLGLTWGAQRWIEFPGLGRLALKTSPSGGARHPIEVYVAALRVKGLPRGLYHYAA